MLKRLVLATRKIDKLDQPLCHCYQTQVNPSLALPLRLLPNQVVCGMYLSKLLHAFVKKGVAQLSRTQPQPSVGSLIELKPKTKLQYSLSCFFCRWQCFPILSLHFVADAKKACWQPARLAIEATWVLSSFSLFPTLSRTRGAKWRICDQF